MQAVHARSTTPRPADDGLYHECHTLPQLGRQLPRRPAVGRQWLIINHCLISRPRIAWLSRVIICADPNTSGTRCALRENGSLRDVNRWATQLIVPHYRLTDPLAGPDRSSCRLFGCLAFLGTSAPQPDRVVPRSRAYFEFVDRVILSVPVARPTFAPRAPSLDKAPTASRVSTSGAITRRALQRPSHRASPFARRRLRTIVLTKVTTEPHPRYPAIRNSHHRRAAVERHWL